MERVRQVDFRQGTSEVALNQFINLLQIKASYWQQELSERVASRILATDQ